MLQTLHNVADCRTEERKGVLGGAPTIKNSSLENSDFSSFLPIFHFKAPQSRQKSLSTHVEGIRNILLTSRNTPGKKYGHTTRRNENIEE